LEVPGKIKCPYTSLTFSLIACGFLPRPLFFVSSQAKELMCPSPTPESYFEKMFSSAGVGRIVVEALVQSAEELDADDPIQAVTSSFSEERFLQVLDGAKHQQAKALAAHCACVRALQVGKLDATASNSKFAAEAGVFEGAYGNMDDFLAGLDAIGLPQPHVFEGMLSEFNASADSESEWETSNYGGITTTPALEWEYVVNPDMAKTYPGGRTPIKIEMFLYAVSAKGFDMLLLDAALDDGERATVQVAVLRRCKAQLDVTFLRKVLLRRVVQAQVDKLVDTLDTALQEHGLPAPSLGASCLGATAQTSGEKHLRLLQQVRELTHALLSEDELERMIEMERGRMRQGNLTKEELIAVRLYTGPPFMKFNTVLRNTTGNLPDFMTKHLQGNKYITSIHTSVSGMVKLSKVSPFFGKK